MGFFENLEKVEKTDLKPEKIGKSTTGKPINCYVLGKGETKILFVGCIHGNEVGTARLVLKILKFLELNPEHQKDKTCYFIPVLSVDGYFEALKHPDYTNRGLKGRVNFNRVDLNRNFETTDWRKDAIWEHGARKIEVSGGEFPFSEPETKALANFVKQRIIDIIFDFHNRGGTVLAAKNKLSQEIAKVYSEFSGYKDVSGRDFQNTGWGKTYFESQDLVYIEIETLKRWGSDWGKNKESLVKTLKMLSNYHKNKD